MTSCRKLGNKRNFSNKKDVNLMAKELKQMFHAKLGSWVTPFRFSKSLLVKCIRREKINELCLGFITRSSDVGKLCSRSNPVRCSTDWGMPVTVFFKTCWRLKYGKLFGLHSKVIKKEEDCLIQVVSVDTCWQQKNEWSVKKVRSKINILTYLMLSQIMLLREGLL